MEKRRKKNSSIIINLIKLNIIAPVRGPITEEIISLITENSSGQIEFMRGHTPIISSTIPTISRIKTANGEEKKIFTATGIVRVKNNIIDFIINLDLTNKLIWRTL